MADAQHPLVVAAFSLALHNGGDLLEAISIAKGVKKLHEVEFPELLDPEEMEDPAVMNKVLDLASSVKAALSNMTDETFVSRAMEKYPQAPSSDLVSLLLTLLCSCIVLLFQDQ